MSKMNNESITTIFYEYVNTDEYEKAFRINSGEVESCSAKLSGMIDSLTTKKEAKEIIDEATGLISAAEKVGFILGFKYAFRLASETFSE